MAGEPLRPLAEIGQKVILGRYLGVGVGVLLLALHLIAGVAGGIDWRVVALATLVAALVPLNLWDRRRLVREGARPSRVIALLLVVLGAQTVAITVTGGIESPLVVIYMPIAVLSPLLLGTPGRYWVLVSLPIALVWGFFALAVAGVLPPGLPGLFAMCPAEPGAIGHLAFLATAISLIIVAGSTGALALRRLLFAAAADATAARAEALDTMRERNRELMELSGTLAHELKNPLASIQGLAALLERKQVSGSRAAEQAQVLLGEARRMGAILDEFLNFSRPTTGLSLRSVQVAPLVREVVVLHEATAAERRVEIRTDVDADTDAGADAALTLRCDPRKVKQVLVNLLQNALEATPPGGSVRISAGRDPAAVAGVRFVIEDSGPGLSPEVAGDVFAPGATTKPAGSGLGLTIARSIAEQHGGSLTVATRTGGPSGDAAVGCRAELRIPDDAGLVTPTDGGLR